MYHHIVAGIFAFIIVAVPEQEASVCVLIVKIIASWHRNERISVEHFTVPFDGLYSHGSHICAQYFKFPVFVSGIEDVFLAVVPCLSINCFVLWLGINPCVVPSSVLQHNGFYLLFWVHYPVSFCIVKLHGYLLVWVVDVNVCNCRDTHANSHAFFFWFGHVEIRCEHVFPLVIVIYGQFIVSTDFWHAFWIGYFESVVCV